MGDPTSAQFVVTPPSGLTVATNPAGGVNLAWTPSPDTIAGYAIYRATNAAGPFTRLNSGLVATNRFADAPASAAVYLVRAVKLESCASGSLFNPSQGIFEDTQGSFNSPEINFNRLGTAIQLSWSGHAVGFQLEGSASLSPAA